MTFGFELPSNPLERATMLENLLVARATGDMTASNHDYDQLRREFINDPELKALLPSFVRTCRTLDVFWPFIKNQAATYAERRQFIGEAFTPLVEHLEGRNRAPGDLVVSDALQTLRNTRSSPRASAASAGCKATRSGCACTCCRSSAVWACRRSRRAKCRNMAGHWQPTAANYLGQVTKAVIVEAVREGVSEDAAVQLADLKKPAMAEAAEFVAHPVAG